MSKLYILGVNIQALTTAVVMASLGHYVGWHVNKDALNTLLKQHAFEHQLIALWQLYRHDGRIHIIQDIDINQADAFWLFTDDATLDQSIVDTLPVASHVFISGHAPLGYQQALAKRAATPFVYYIPFVFLKDGMSFTSMLSPHLFLIGEKTKNTAQSAELLAPIVKNADAFAISSIKNTELARSGIMTMLASRLSFINELSRLAEYADADIITVKNMMGMDTRIGKTYLNPSWGFGGFTLPSELHILQEDFARYGMDTTLIKAISDINEEQKELLFRKFWQYFDSFIQDKKVLIWGAGYKAGSGRTLGSAIHPLLNLMWHHNVTTYVYDKQAEAELSELYARQAKHSSQLIMVDDAYGKLPEVDALFIINWPDVAPVIIDKLAHTKVAVFDGQNLLTNEEIGMLHGFYTGVGRKQ